MNDTTSLQAQQELSVDEVAQLLESRAAFYRMLASLLWQPLSQESIDAMAANDFGAFADISDVCAAGANDMHRYLRKRHSGTRRELACDFTSVFGGTHSYKGRYATPYESLFADDEGRFYADSYRGVLNAYKHERVKLSGKDYPEDHLSFMCEFMALESVRAAEALKAGDAAEARRCVEASHDFLAEHILSWYGRFEGLALQLIETRFYRGVVKIAEGWFARDAEQLEELAAMDLPQRSVA